mmetsp:Transcript_32479/g.76428  ORF Transcript_32479/g.76428 Transcript_32479/m.76428 type:complete len:205 (+) Transcript_32479:110-724(+)
MVVHITACLTECIQCMPACIHVPPHSPRLWQSVAVLLPCPFLGGGIGLVALVGRREPGFVVRLFVFVFVLVFIFIFIFGILFLSMIRVMVWIPVLPWFGENVVWNFNVVSKGIGQKEILRVAEVLKQKGPSGQIRECDNLVSKSVFVFVLVFVLVMYADPYGGRVQHLIVFVIVVSGIAVLFFIIDSVGVGVGVSISISFSCCC